ncbi:GIY-YIG catalytic domain-containing protein [Methanococcoides vulcani]|uniref:GIY-YIG catalytic domain-containing protein n=1 Tax=Methanococcoides vulcani TaxID=1353158 RepID=A0A1I0AAQ6_9EURY|nr:GIY-YIG nuclease family protein [Methanococcoides vulcani]SES91276.1 GIY-YIG catalytic domain-containing protein [Methanococcoides vulcani]
MINVRGWDWTLDYPDGKSDIIYIGESEDIGRRLKQHKSSGKNLGLAGYAKRLSLNIYLRKVYHKSELERHEAYMINQFANKYGSIPICNGQRPDAD